MVKEQGTNVLTSVISRVGPLLFVTLCLYVGIHIGTISDYGWKYTVENIQRNPASFAGQYARIVVVSGWISVAVVGFFLLMVAFEVIRRKVS